MAAQGTCRVPCEARFRQSWPVQRSPSPFSPQDRPAEGVAGTRACGPVRIRARGSLPRQQRAPCHPEVREGDQRHQMRPVLCTAPVSRLHVTELPHDDPERVLDLRADRGRGPLRYRLGRPWRTAPRRPPGDRKRGHGDRPGNHRKARAGRCQGRCRRVRPASPAPGTRHAGCAAPVPPRRCSWP